MTDYRVYVLYRTEGVTKSNVLVTDNDNKLVFPSSEVEYRVTKSFSVGDLEKIRDKIINGEEENSSKDELYTPGTLIEIKEVSPIKSVQIGIVSPVKIKEVMIINKDQLNLLIEHYAQVAQEYDASLEQIDANYSSKINEAEEAVLTAEKALKDLQRSLRKEKGQLLTPGQTLEEIIRKLK